MDWKNAIRRKLCECFTQENVMIIDQAFNDAVADGRATEDWRSTYYMICIARKNKPEFASVFE